MQARETVNEEDLKKAIQLVILPRATIVDPPEQDEQQPPPPPPPPPPPSDEQEQEEEEQEEDEQEDQEQEEQEQEVRRFPTCIENLRTEKRITGMPPPEYCPPIHHSESFKDAMHSSTRRGHEPILQNSDIA